MVVVLLLMWNVVGPFKTGNLDDWEEVEEIRESHVRKSNQVMSVIVIQVECTREVDTETIDVKIDTEMIEEGTIEEEETIVEIDTETIEGEIDVMTDTAAADVDTDQDRDPENEVDIVGAVVIVVKLIMNAL